MIGGIGQLSRRPGMPSAKAIRRIIAEHANFPMIARGKGGRAYQIDLDAAEEFIRQVQAGRIMDIEHRLRALREFGMVTALEAEERRLAEGKSK